MGLTWEQESYLGARGYIVRVQQRSYFEAGGYIVCVQQGSFFWSRTLIFRRVMLAPDWSRHLVFVAIVQLSPTRQIDVDAGTECCVGREIQTQQAALLYRTITSHDLQNMHQTLGSHHIERPP